MQLGNDFSLKVENYAKRTPLTLKVFADICLLLIPITESAKVGCPAFPGKEWLFWGLITFFSLFKIVSKFVTNSHG
jgi:hypothetical protein